jgi:hypothetical protein
MNKIILVFCLLCLAGCAPATVTEYVYISVPVRCEIERPVPPQRQEDALLTLIDILSYTRKLEVALNACTGGSNESE